MHKSAGQLQVRDCFSLAGAHYEIVRIYETAGPNMIKIAFVTINGELPVQYMILERSTFFITL